MKPEELQFGNLALFDGKIITVESQNAIDSAAYLDPLPLSSALMTQRHGYGFQLAGDCKLWMLNRPRMIELLLQQRLNSWWLLVGWGEPLNKFMISYYHELQNLYKAHTDEELADSCT